MAKSDKTPAPPKGPPAASTAKGVPAAGRGKKWVYVGLVEDVPTP